MIDLAPRNPNPLELETPLLAAAGSLGYGVEVARQIGLGKRGAAHGLGAIITRTTTPLPRRGRPLPALLEVPAGALYTGGNQNPGLRVVLERFAPVWATWELPVLLSIAAADAEELVETVAELDLLEGVRGLELPLGAMDMLLPGPAASLVGALRAATPLPLIVKLPGHAPDLVALAQAVEAAGADAVSLIGPLPAAAPGTAGLVEGALCGPALRPLALRAVAMVAAAVEVPVVGGGGVMTLADARALLDAGARAVALGTALLSDLRAAARIAAGLTGALTP
ncbi:MAG: dihydroorotate dehydrogenase [Chloroflexi bacterium OHK40]